MSVDDRDFSSGEVEKLLAEFDGGGSIASLANLAPRLARAYLALLSENQMLKGCNGNPASGDSKGPPSTPNVRVKLCGCVMEEQVTRWWADVRQCVECHAHGDVR